LLSRKGEDGSFWKMIRNNSTWQSVTWLMNCNYFLSAFTMFLVLVGTSNLRF